MRGPTKTRGGGKKTEVPAGGETTSTRAPAIDALPEKFAFLFEGLSDEAIMDRLDYYELILDPTEGIERQLEDARDPVAPEELIFDNAVGFLVELNRRLAERLKIPEVAESAARTIDLMREAAGHGETRGEQRAAYLYRHPGASSPKVETDGRQFRSPHQAFFPAIQIANVYDRLLGRWKSLLRTKSYRDSNRVALFQELRSHPAVAKLLKAEQDVVALTPAAAARAHLTHVLDYEGGYGRLSDDRVKQIIAEARSRGRRKSA